LNGLLEDKRRAIKPYYCLLFFHTRIFIKKVWNMRGKLKTEKLVSRSPWLAHFNTAACNGCDIEILAMLSPHYDPERLGVRLTPSVRHADILVVTGAVNKKAAVRLKRLYDQMAEPKYVVAIGACAISGGVFAKSYNLYAGADKVVPIVAHIPGCPPRPEAILDGVAKVLDKLGKGK
jgi:membrane-bound hydrogenase subunit mbhJ